MYHISMDINERREEILTILADREYVTVEEFSKVLGVSAVTIRTDLTSLEESAPAQDDATYCVNLENDGEPTVLDDEAITENVAG